MSEHSPEIHPPSPGDSVTPAKLSAPKTKQCPFCGDYFTSSSLGRHLDLYIKDKNPKAPDGIHDVDKIRQIRANITRRQPRRSTKMDHSTPASNGQYAAGSAESPYSFVVGSDERRVVIQNKPTWEATGVMTDIPTDTIPTAGIRLDLAARRPPSRSDIVMRRRILEDRTRLRAAELALQELLDSVNAASAQAHPPSPFDFDFLSQSFPALCLRLLPRQPTLSSAQVIENPNFCPVGPPGKPHYELLRQRLRQRLENLTTRRSRVEERQDLRELFSPESSQKEAVLNEPPDASSYYDHLSRAFNVWTAAPDSQKASLWHLETLRAYASAQDESTKVGQELAQAQTQIAHLRLQLVRLNECQQPKEYTFSVPTNHEIDTDTIQALATAKADTPLDRESLIKKWAAVVKNDRKYQRELPELELAELTTPDSRVPPERREGETDGENAEQASENDGDSEDAAGEVDDDVGAHQNGINGNVASSTKSTMKVNTGTLDRDVLDPSLRDDDDEEEDGAMEVDMGDFGAEKLLADMRARTTTAD